MSTQEGSAYPKLSPTLRFSPLAAPKSERHKAMRLSRRGLLKCASALAAMSAGSSPLQTFAQRPAKPLVVDCHGHYTTEPEALNVFRGRADRGAQVSV
jgi:hypothetical protein